MEINAQAQKMLNEVDAGLNNVYLAILAKYENNPNASEKTRRSQREWLKMIENNIKEAYPLKKGENPSQVYGSIYQSEYCEIRAGMILDRIKELQKTGGKQEFDLTAFYKAHEGMAPVIDDVEKRVEAEKIESNVPEIDGNEAYKKIRFNDKDETLEAAMAESVPEGIEIADSSENVIEKSIEPLFDSRLKYTSMPIHEKKKYGHYFVDGFTFQANGLRNNNVDVIAFELVGESKGAGVYGVRVSYHGIIETELTAKFRQQFPDTKESVEKLSLNSPTYPGLTMVVEFTDLKVDAGDKMMRMTTSPTVSLESAPMSALTPAQRDVWSKELGFYKDRNIQLHEIRTLPDFDDIESYRRAIENGYTATLKQKKWNPLYNINDFGIESQLVNDPFADPELWILSRSIGKQRLAATRRGIAKAKSDADASKAKQKEEALGF